MDFLEKINKLPESVRNFFCSDMPRLESEKVCFMYGLEENQIKLLTKPTGLMFVGKARIEQLPNILATNLNVPADIIYGISYELNRRLFVPFPEYFKNSKMLLDKWESQKSEPVISEDEAWRKVLEIEPWIAKEEKSKRQEARKKEQRLAGLKKITLNEAIGKYPEIGDQIITASPIKLKNYPEPARPSIKNWLSDYISQLGRESHSIMQRGNYLFQSENGKKLNMKDRQRLAVILKSFDENLALNVNAEEKQIVFPIFQETGQNATQNQEKTNPGQKINSNWQKIAGQNQAPAKLPVSNEKTPGGNLNFSSPQKLPHEHDKEQEKKEFGPKPYRIRPGSSKPMINT